MSSAAGEGVPAATGAAESVPHEVVLARVPAEVPAAHDEITLVAAIIGAVAPVVVSRVIADIAALVVRAGATAEKQRPCGSTGANEFLR